MDRRQIDQEEIPRPCIVENLLVAQKTLDDCLNSFDSEKGADSIPFRIERISTQKKAYQSFIPTQVTDELQTMTRVGMKMDTHQRAFQLPSRLPSRASYRHQGGTALEFGEKHQVLCPHLWHNRVPEGAIWPMQLGFSIPDRVTWNGRNINLRSEVGISPLYRDLLHRWVCNAARGNTW
jgi:hypothetical protein